MNPRLLCLTSATFFVGLACAIPGRAQSPTTTEAPATGAAPAVSDPAVPQLREAFVLLQQQKPDAALEKVSAVIKAEPKNSDAYILRANIYSTKKSFDLAEADYTTALQIDGNSAVAKFNLSEIKFRQKQYDDARPGFLALEPDADLGDLALYKVFLCDLFGGHGDVAAKELAKLNEIGSNPSYYFANAASDLYQKKIEDARGWLQSAFNIYPARKIVLYESSLKDLGYLPLPPATTP